MDLIVKILFGSHLYGTNTENSDQDFKGVFMPTKEEILLNRVLKSISHSTGQGHSKNTSEDVDTEIYSLHYFIELACKGETVALDMLHAPDNRIIESSDVWESLRANKDKFYTKNLKAFVGYARKQASKYGIKGSRLNNAKVVLDFLENNLHLEGATLDYIWELLPEGEHIHKLGLDKNNRKQYQVCGRILQDSVKLPYALSVIKQFHDNYGERARLAAENKGIDWKAISHALRAAMQVKEILLTGNLSFPLKEAGYLRKVKTGKLDYLTNVAPHLEALMDELEALSLVSKLPEKVDREYWDKFIVETLEYELFE